MLIRHDIGLVAAGEAGRGFLSRLPRLKEKLGPVISPQGRVATRISGMLNAGNPTTNWEELAECSVILLHVPANQIPRSIVRLARLEIGWKGKAVAVCQTRDDASILSSLAARGAATASLAAVELGADTLFVMEGDAPAIRHLRALLEGAGQSAYVLERGKKEYFLAGSYLTGRLCEPLLDSALESFRLAGLDPARASRLTQLLFESTLRSYLRCRRKGWVYQFGTADQEAMKEIARRARRTSPLLSRLLEMQAEVCEEFVASNRRRKARARQLTLPGTE